MRCSSHSWWKKLTLTTWDIWNLKKQWEGPTDDYSWAGFLPSNSMGSWSALMKVSSFGSGKSPEVRWCRGCVREFLCLVSDFIIVNGTYLLSIVGSFATRVHNMFPSPQFLGLFFTTSGEKNPSCDLLTDPTLRPFSKLTGWLTCSDSTMLSERDYRCSDSTMLSERGYWLATIFVRNPPNWIPTV